ncbi:uncharacterized protein LOC112041919 [Lingula anatina]|uniref:Uncharacterized protein LOC112041919 n=1 Tax=Lingula anatina TaxID=7574 RepID=A0A2R2MMK4_LINAN|nr:uncharacterized protein LOC112041919 [Lingula anatina]|eukprot:XP_023931458.1 uncharacterized protein LOC112041919 [Lingula anatina]
MQIRLLLSVLGVALICQSARAQEVITVCRGEADLAFLVDSSDSLGEADFKTEMDFVSRMVRGFDIGPDNVRVGMVTFASSSDLRFKLNEHPTQAGLLKAVDDVPFTPGATATHLGLSRARLQLFVPPGDRRGIVNIAIILTDGASTFPDRTKIAAEMLKRQAIVYAIGIGKELNEDELALMATDSDKVFIVTSFEQLLQFRSRIADAICTSVVTLLPNTTTTTTTPRPTTTTREPTTTTRRTTTTRAPTTTTTPTTTTPYVPPVTVDIDEHCGKCVVNGGPLTENGALGYVLNPYSCTSYWVCIRRPERGPDGWMYDVIERNCSIGTVWDQDMQTCARCDDPRAICKDTAPKPPMGTPHCPFPEQKTTTPPFPEPSYTLDQECVDAVGNTMVNVIEDAAIYYIRYGPDNDVGPISCFPYNFSISACRCEAPESIGIIFPYEEDYASIGKIAYSEASEIGNVTLCSDYLSDGVTRVSAVGESAVCLDGEGHVEMPSFKNSPPQTPFTIHFFYWLDNDVDTAGRKIALLNNAKCDIPPTIDIYYSNGAIGVGMTTINGTYQIDPVSVANGAQGRWVCVVMTYNSKRMSLYLDGQRVDRVKARGEMKRTESAWILGNNCFEDKTMDNFDSNFKGKFDQVSVYYRVLDDDEIQQICTI